MQRDSVSTAYIIYFCNLVTKEDARWEGYIDERGKSNSLIHIVSRSNVYYEFAIGLVSRLVIGNDQFRVQGRKVLCSPVFFSFLTP